MPRTEARKPRSARLAQTRKTGSEPKPEPRFTVALPSETVKQVERYAASVDVSFSKAVAALVRLGLEGQESRKREFFSKLKSNLANDDPSQQDQLVDEFRALILGR